MLTSPVLTLIIGAATDTGNLRLQNEDSFVAEGDLLAVADGMGGHNAGEVASAMAIAHLRSAVSNGVANAQDFTAIIQTINAEIYAAATSTSDQRGMGTTLTTATLVVSTDALSTTPQMVVANVGDSRTYLMRDGEFKQLSVDHSYVQELVTEGLLTLEEARTHPRRNIVTRALGIDKQVSVDTWTIPVFAGDRLMLCSDGLVDEVPADEIAETMNEHITPQQIADRLVAAAKRYGGRDNITVIVVDISAADITVSVDTAASTTTATAPTRFVKRRLVFSLIGIIGVLALAIGGAFAVTRQRSGYFVGFSNKSPSATVTLYKGRPGGLLWIKPTQARSTSISRNSLLGALQRDVEKLPHFDSLSAAQKYIDALRKVELSNG